MTEQVNKLAEQEGNDLEQYFSESSLESVEEQDPPEAGQAITV